MCSDGSGHISHSVGRVVMACRTFLVHSMLYGVCVWGLVRVVGRFVGLYVKV